MNNTLAKRALLMIVLISLIALIFVSSVSIGVVQASGPIYTTHSTMRINSNGDLITLKSSGGCTGSGTVSDPYVINGYDITGNGVICIYIGNVTEHLVIDNCYLHGNSYGIELVSSSNVTISNDNFYANTVDGIYLSSASNNTVSGNTFSYDDIIDIDLYNSTINVIKDNVCSGNSNHGIYLQQSGSNILSNNSCLDSFACGIMLSSSSNNIISNNTSNANGNNGIHLASSSNYNTISNNTCKGNAADGIHLTSPSNHNTIRHNNCSGNNHDGIELSSSSNNSIADNNCSGNHDYSIYLNFSNNNRLYGNVLIENRGALSVYNALHVQAYDDGKNTWNNTAMGNYWSDWQTPDANHDGIVDHPYIIDGSSGAEDYHPMVIENDFVSIDIIYPVSGSFNNTGSVTVMWITTDSGPGIAQTEIQADYGAWNIVTGTRDTLSLSDGSHTITLRVTDNDGDVNTTSVTLTVDTLAPSVVIDSPTSNSYNNTGSVTTKWTAIDSGSGIAKTEIKVDAGSYSITTSTSDLLTGLSGGSHTVTVKVTDNAGNVNSTSVTFTVDTVKPALNIVTPVPGSWCNTTRLNVTWMASDSGSGLVYFWVSLDHGQKINVTSDYIVLTGLTDGQHTVEVHAYDMAGNYNDTVCIFNIDTVKPTIDIIAPIGGELLNYSKVEVSWSGSDNASGIADYWVNIDGGVWTNVTKNMSYSLVSLADGQHIISVKVEDNAGNSNESSVTFVVDTIAPTITAHSPTGNDVTINDSLKTTIYVYFSETMNLSSVQFRVNGVNCTLNWAGNATFITPFRLPYNTTYFVNVTGEDLAGNAVGYSWSFTTMKNEGTIDGIIRDANGAPIANATITLSNGMVAKTDAFGHFSFTNVTTGSYNMYVSKDGYQTITQNVNTTAGQTNYLGLLNVQANSAPLDLEMIIGILVVIAAVLGVGVLLLRKRKN